jgi:pimeloyl-ACP methyl ester carboxylesterase
MTAIYKSSEGERLVRERYQALLRHWPVPNEQIHIPTTQGSTFVVVSGPKDAPWLLLLHGGAANSAMWMGDARAFASSFRVCCIDMIGEPGLSAPARPSLGSDAYAVWLDEVLNHLSIGRAAVVGISLGGWLGLDYAIRRPERVEKVAVLCPGGIGRQKVGIVLATLVLRMFGKWGRRKLMERIVGRAPANPAPPLKAFFDFVALIHRHFRPRMVKLPIFSDEALRNLKGPVLAIVGGRDVLLDSAQTKRRLEQHAPNARIVYLPETGHLISGQTGRIVEFLRATSRSDGGTVPAEGANVHDRSQGVGRSQ